MNKRRVTALLLITSVLIGTLSIYNALFNKAAQKQALTAYVHVNDYGTQGQKDSDSTGPTDARIAALALLRGKVPTKRRRRFIWRRTLPKKPMTAMNAQETQIIFDIVEKLVDVCKSRNITYFMYSGTLLGSYRHHDIIPWDDDVDVLVRGSRRAALHEALDTLAPRYIVAYAGPRLKFYSAQSTQLSKYPWGWPYVDISFFYENATHIGDISQQFSHNVYPKSIVFPLHPRPLGNMFLNSPFDAYASLMITFSNLHYCMTFPYSHKYEIVKSMKTYIKMSCEKLKKHVPFVHRSASNNGVRETLMLGDNVIHSIVVKEPRYAVVTTFSLELS